MRKSFSYKADINKVTELKCLSWIESCRKLYNTALEQRVILWNSRKKSITYIDQTYEMKYLRREFPEYADINSQVLQDPLKRVDLAFQSFYKRCRLKDVKAGFPKFKPKGFYRSITFKNTGWELEGKHLNIYNVGKFKLFLSRPIQGDIKTITIRRSMTNKWFVSFSCDNVPEKIRPQTDNEIVIKDDGSLTTPDKIQKSIDILDKRRNSIECKQKDSNRRSKSRFLIERIYEKIVNQRKNHLHKISNKLITENDVIIVIDKPKKSKMVDDKTLLNMGWYILKEMLTYKSKETNKILISKKEKKDGTY